MSNTSNLDNKVVDKEDKKDRIYAEPADTITGFKFDEKVSRVFDNMIARSVPGYHTVSTFLPLLVKRFVPGEFRVYDLGCSTGQISKAILQHSQAKVIAVDNSPAMLQRAEENIGANPRIEFLCRDIMDLEFMPAAMVVMNYTLQFIKLEERQRIIQSIYGALEPGGAFVLTEKIAMANETEAAVVQSLHEDFKRAQGYSELEISQKRSALEQVLIPETSEVHLDRLRGAGFPCAFMWFQSLNFASYLAVK